MLLQMCPYEVPRTIDDGDYLSFIHSRDGVVPQDIHMDSLPPGWSFLIEHDQELLILWNGHKVVRVIDSIAGERQAATSYVREVMEGIGRKWMEARKNERRRLSRAFGTGCVLWPSRLTLALCPPCRLRALQYPRAGLL